MKRSRFLSRSLLKLFTVAGLLTSPPAYAGGVFVGVGGGNLIKPTEAEVREEVSKMWSQQPHSSMGRFFSSITGLKYRIRHSGFYYQIRDVRANAVINRLIQPEWNSPPVLHDRISYQIRPTCTMEGKSVAAAVELNQLGPIDTLPQGGVPERRAVICYSLTELTQASTVRLDLQLLALTWHEVSHLFGFDEDHADAIQRLVHRIPGAFGNGQDKMETMVSKLVNLRIRAAVTQRRIEIGQPDMRIASDIGQIVGLSGTAHDYFYANDFSNPESLGAQERVLKSSELMSEVRYLTNYMLPFAGGDWGSGFERYPYAQPLATVAELGNRDDLRRRLIAYDEKIKNVLAYFRYNESRWAAQIDLDLSRIK